MPLSFTTVTAKIVHTSNSSTTSTAALSGPRRRRLSSCVLTGYHPYVGNHTRAPVSINRVANTRNRYQIELPNS